jgi:outer membrane protein assembly factor BamD
MPVRGSHRPTPGQGRGAGRPLARVVAAVLCVAALGGCSSIGNFFGGEKDLLADEPADRLYNEGVFLLNEKSNYREAAKKFEEVDRQHPYSDWARRSLLMTAYANYESGAYDEAITAAKRYLSLHPGSQDAAYAQYLIAASYYDQIPDVSRDQTRTEKAIAALEEVGRKYPNSEYAAQAQKKIEVGRDQLAAKEMNIARFYLQKKNFIGAINRFKVVVTQYQTTRHVEEALMRLAESYMALGIRQEAQTAAAVLGHNFPDSPWYKDAYSLVRSGGLEPQENKASWMSKAFKKIGLG